MTTPVYDQGWRAGYRGLPITDNPYQGAEAIEWRNGYNSGSWARWREERKSAKLEYAIHRFGNILKGEPA